MSQTECKSPIRILLSDGKPHPVICDYRADVIIDVSGESPRLIKSRGLEVEIMDLPNARRKRASYLRKLLP